MQRTLNQTAAPAAIAAPTPASPRRPWQKIVAQYTQSDLRQGLWQVANSFVPFILTWVLAYFSLRVSYLLTLALAVVGAGFMMRIFIILHDCGHGSFFKSQRANNFLGAISGIFAFTPYFQWRHNHAIHHATAGDLDRRASWDVPLTYTVSEFLAAPKWKQIMYRLYRHPLILFGIAPSILFLVAQRIVTNRVGKRERFSVIFTNVALLAVFMVLGYFLGFGAVVAVQLPIIIIGATIGVWLFYVQHQFEDTYWEHTEEWVYADAALQGSSYYKLPKLLQWFSGNIGLHHIHHLSSRIPNYALQRCHDENPEFQQVSTLTLFTSLKCVSLRLWDEQTQKLVGWDHLKALQAAQQPA
jgi:omega-6 fatty acid desaturase (delta-12 desaturase)